MLFHKRERRRGRSVSADSLRIADLMLLVALQKNNGNLTDAGKEMGVSQPAGQLTTAPGRSNSASKSPWSSARTGMRSSPLRVYR